MRHRFGLAVAVQAVALMLGLPAAGWATSHTATFDDLLPGTPVGTQYPGLGFGAVAGGLPSVFAPSHGATATTPNALHAAAACDPGCANGAYRIVMDFNPPASRVDLQAGLDDEPSGEIPTCGRLRAFASGGGLVAESGDVSLGDGGTYTPITHALRAADPGGQPTIVQAIYSSGKETAACDTGAPRRANVDSVAWEDATVTPPPRPAPPVVTISAPPNSTFFDRAEDVKVTGVVRFDTNISPVSAFCVVSTDGPAGAFPAECADAQRLTPDPGAGNVFHFTDLTPAGLHGGLNYVHAWVRDRDGQVAHASVTVVVADDRSGLDTRVDGIEVTQSVQEASIPMSAEGFVVPYHGVDLLAGAHTIVRVFADAPGLARVGVPVHRVQLTLAGYAEPDGNGFPALLPGGPLLPDNGAHDLVHGSNVVVPAARRSDPDGGYVFTLPADWVRQERRIRLVAEVNPVGMAASVPEAASRRADNTLSVTGIQLHHRNPVTINPIAVTWLQPGTSTTWVPGPISDVFRELRNLVPLADDALRIRPYQATVDVTDVARATQDLVNDGDPAFAQSNARNDQSFNRVAEVARRIDGGQPIGVNRGPGSSDLARGKEAPVFYGPTFDDPGRFEVKDVAIVNQGRPRTSVPHEFFHSMHFFHAGYYCTTDFPYVEWDPDHRGALDSYGLNRAQPGPRAGTFAIFPDTPDYLDIMSYCSRPESNYWISAHNWNLFGRVLPEVFTTSSSSGGARSAARTAARTAAAIHMAPARRLRAGTPLLSVVATVHPDGAATIDGLQPGSGAKATASDEAAALRLVVLDTAGSVLSSTGVNGQVSHVDGVPGQLSTLISATVPAPAGAARLELRSDGHAVATAARSAHAPTVRVIAPRRGARVGGARKVTVSWKAADADGAAPAAELDLSLDGGTHWRALTGPLSGSSTRLAPALIPRSARARIRVRVSDGWNTASALSAPFRSAGVPPQVTILAPARGAALMAEGTLYASGQAVSDDGRFLSGRRLTWRDGRRVIGHGVSVSVQGLAAGRHRLVLIARDARGRTGRGTVTVKVSGQAPDLVGLKLPKRLAAKAHRLTLSTGATVPCRLRIGGRRFALDRMPRRLVLRIRPGRRPLKLSLLLSAGGASTRIVVVVPRP